jgi:hypothetical protein
MSLQEFVDELAPGDYHVSKLWELWRPAEWLDRTEERAKFRYALCMAGMVAISQRKVRKPARNSATIDLTARSVAPSTPGGHP